MKSVFITIVGRPNVGKSTLTNKLVNEKVAIVSDKAGTTRDQIKGIVNMTNVVIKVSNGVKVENLSIINALNLIK